jgi:hypothetical protein
MFSWYGLKQVNRTGKLRPHGQRQVSPEIIIGTLESLAILVSDPPLNRKREKLPGAKSVEQVKCPHPKTVRHYLEQILQRLPEEPGA